MPKITCSILGLYISVFGAICEICGYPGTGMKIHEKSRQKVKIFITAVHGAINGERTTGNRKPLKDSGIDLQV